MNTASIVIGTAGHIDHGKTTLVKALTGRDLDTLGEEIRRGITISPGFTWLETASGLRAGLVDVPGHERFIKNMIAGASGIDYAMLVVAANDGVKPQTLEHLWILETLGLRTGIVVLTKCDIVDELMVELACDDIRTALKGTFLENAALVQVDSHSGRGIAGLKSMLGGAVTAAAARNTFAPARMNIDRVFTKKGFGAVVTGTLAEGVIAVGDELWLYPQGADCKARGIQIHESAAESVSAGTRTAINLAGAKAADIKRGDVLSAAKMKGSVYIDVKLRLFPKAAKGVAFWDRLRLYHGTREVFCRCVPLSVKEISPGGEDFCQLRLESELFCKKDDYFVVRTYSPMETIGGGTVVDPAPQRHSRMTDELYTALSVKEAGEVGGVLADYIQSNPGAASAEIASYAGLGAAETEGALSRLVSDGLITTLAGLYYCSDFVESLKDAALVILDNYHKSAPLKKGMPKEELRSKLNKFATKTHKKIDAVIGLLEGGGLVRSFGGTVALSGFEIKPTNAQQAAMNEVLGILENGGFSPPSYADIVRGGEVYAEAVNILSPDNVIFLDKSTIMHVKYYHKAKELLMGHFADNDEITLASFRDLLGTSRKFAQLIVERFDDERVTVRVGDVRRAGN